MHESQNNIVKRLFESKRLQEATSTKAYKVEFNYPGDELSDYIGSILVTASSPNEAISKAKKSKKLQAEAYMKDGGKPSNFKVVDTFDSVDEYKRKYPRSNVMVESTKIEEAWHPVLNQLSDYEKKNLRKTLINAGIDIENTDSNLIKLTSNRDPRLKGNGVVIMDFGRRNIGVWMNGKAIVKPNFTHLSSNSWQNIIAAAEQIYYMEYNEDSAKALKQKQDNRKALQPSQSVTRYPKGVRPSSLDKSGYVRDLTKYQKMLAELKLNDASKVLSDAKEVYIKLANKLDDIDFENDGSWDNYDTIMRQIQRYFAELKRYNNEYEKVKSKSDDVSKFQMEWVKTNVQDAIRNLREYMLKAKKYL